MSHSSSPLDVAGWTNEDFASSWKKILPGLISDLEKSDDVATEVFKIVYVSIVPVVPAKDLNETVFSQICEKTTSHVGKVIDSVVDFIGSADDDENASDDVSQTLNIILKVSIDIISSIDACVNYLSGGRTHLTLADLRLLPYCILGVLDRSFAHCRDSNHLYGRWFGHVSGRVTDLFKAARLLQTNFTGLLEKLDVSYPTEQDKEDLCYIIQKLCLLCDTASHLDIKVMIALWKTVSRLSCQYKDCILTQLDICDMLCSLCENMSSSCSYFFQPDTDNSQADESRLGKLIKIIGFQMRVLVTLTKEYSGYLGDSIGTIYQLILQIRSFLPPSLISRRCPSGCREDLVKHIGTGLEPLIDTLIDSKEFVALATEVNEETCEFGIARLMNLLTISRLLSTHSEDIQTEWLKPPFCYPEDKPRQSLIDAIFSCIPLCYTELCLPVYLPGIAKCGTVQGELTMYEYVVTQLCAFAVSFPLKHFNILEKCLLEKVLSRRQHCALIAIDIWCFVARCGSAELCHNHCSFLVSLLIEASATSLPECCHLVSLVRRLFRLMAPDHQMELVSSTTNLELLSILPVAFSTPDVHKIITNKITNSFNSAVSGWTATTARTVLDARNLSSALSALSNVCRVPTHVLVSDQFTPEQQTDVANKCALILSDLPLDGVVIDSSGVSRCLFETIVSSTLFVISYLAPELDNRLVCETLAFSYRTLSSANAGDVVKLNILKVLESLAAKMFPPSSEQAQILRLLPKLFAVLLDDTNVIVREKSMEIFADFARKTSYEDLVSDSVDGNETIYVDFVAYINKHGNHSEKADIDIAAVHLQRDLIRRWCLAAPTRSLKASVSSGPFQADLTSESGNVLEPETKRLKIVEEETTTTTTTLEDVCSTLRVTLDQLETSVSALEDLRKKRPFPGWSFERISDVNKRLSAMT